MSERVSTCAPRMNPLTPVPMLDPNWYHLRVLRSLKNVFQSNFSVDIACESGDGTDEGEGAEEA